jgi:AcrR family transcriptional regulator
MIRNRASASLTMRNLGSGCQTEMTRVVARSIEKVVPEPTATPGMRADAARNRQRILEAAEEIFSGNGKAVPIDVVAERAGLGIGTLYRHFPTKEALFCAIVIDRFEKMVRELQPISETDDPGAALTLFIDKLVEQFALKKDLMDALGAEQVSYGERMVCAKNDLHVVLDKILERGRSAGCVREGVTGVDVFRMVHGVYAAAGDDGAARTRFLSVMRDGLNAQKKRVSSLPPSRARSRKPTGPRRGSAR